MPKLLARLGLGSAPAVTGPLAGPALQAPIVAAGLTGVAIVLHYLLWVVAPVNLLPLWLGFRRHGDPWGIGLGVVGSILVVAALLVHEPFHLAEGLHDLTGGADGSGDNHGSRDPARSPSGDLGSGFVDLPGSCLRFLELEAATVRAEGVGEDDVRADRDETLVVTRNLFWFFEVPQVWSPAGG